MHLTLLAVSLLTAEPAFDFETQLSLPTQGNDLILIESVQDTRKRPVALMLLLLADGAKTGAALRAVDGHGHKTVRDFPAKLFAPTGWPGVPALALSFRLEQGEWVLVEAKPTTAEACGARGVEVLTRHRL